MGRSNEIARAPVEQQYQSLQLPEESKAVEFMQMLVRDLRNEFTEEDENDLELPLREERKRDLLAMYKVWIVEKLLQEKTVDVASLAKELVKRYRGAFDATRFREAYHSIRMLVSGDTGMDDTVDT